MNNRDRYRERSYRNRPYREENRNWRQEEQLQDNYRGGSDFDQGYRDEGQMGDTYSRGRYDDMGEARGYGSDADLEQAGYRRRQRRGYTNTRIRDFDGDNYGGEDYVTGGTRSQGGYGGGVRNEYGPSRGYGNAMAAGAGPYGGGSYIAGQGRDERGFFDKAGDKVASWFGDEHAERRREQDHRGRGPSNYKRSDERILEDACDNLTEDWGVDARDIQVTVDKGDVTLDGTVKDRRAKRRAEDCVYCISGVDHVQNNLRVQDRDRTRDNDYDKVREVSAS